MTTRTYPGMLDRSIEYFAADGEVYKMRNGLISLFEEDNHPELEILIATDSVLETTLTEMCGKDHNSKLRKLAECRFGGLNFEPDFNDDTSTPDHRDCGLRGKCVGENVVCKPIKINGEAVDLKEIEILRECATNHKNLAIASILNIPFGTLNVLKTRIYEKCGFVTKQQSAITLFEKGLL